MSLFDDDIVLPGVVTEIISDYSSGYDTSLFGTTDSVLVIGTAFNGPVGRAIEIYSPEHAQYVFGQVYDSTTRKETTLVANIQDTWNRGCRTIYACRVSGKDIYKDYELAVDTDLKLRVCGIFPSNSNKDLSMLFNKDTYEMSMGIYKPAERATINEKQQGVVESSDSIILNTIDLYGSGITLESELTELIKVVNGYLYNNVIRLAIVDENGNDVTLSSIEAKSLRVGDMFPGLYTIGRDANAKEILADTNMSLVLDAAPYDGFEGIFYKKLSLNTNVSKNLPLYSENGDLNIILGISSIDEYEFLQNPGMIDDYFLKNSIDYEEVDLTDFELYKKLGSGFAINACIDVKSVTLSDGTTKIKAKVKEVTDKDKKKAQLSDGIFSTLENVPSNYRVLTKAFADQKIKGTLPKANDFKFANSQSIKLLNDSISIASIVDSKDLTESKTYDVSFVDMTDAEVTELNTVKANLYTDKTVREATLIDFTALDFTKVYDEGSLFLVTNVTDPTYSKPLNLLYTYTNGKLICAHTFDVASAKDILKNSLIMAGGKIFICDKYTTEVGNPLLGFNSFVEITLADVNNKTFVIVSIDNGSFVIAKLVEDSTTHAVTATVLGTVDQVLSVEEDKLLTSISNIYGTNKIVIKSNQYDFLTIDEVVDLLNEDKDFQKILTITTLNVLKAQDCIDDIKGVTGVLLEGSFVNKAISYDTTLLIPFRTDDNFARQFAQHCMYTSLKTSPTHGIMGVKTLLDTSVDSITSRVTELVNLKLDSTLVAKKGNGANMLDKNNMPYPIGRKLSVIVGQYSLTTDSNYTTISNMAAGYAGMVSCLALDQSSTCQAITIPDLTYEFTNYQLGLLTNAGFVTIKDSFTKGWVVTDGITMAPSDSSYKRLSASRIADAIERLIRTACEPFIGKQNHLANQNSLRAAIKSQLDTIKNTLIEAYDFKLILDKSSTKLGIINIDYAIVPIYEIKEIKNNITVSDS